MVDVSQGSSSASSPPLSQPWARGGIPLGFKPRLKEGRQREDDRQREPLGDGLRYLVASQPQGDGFEVGPPVPSTLNHQTPPGPVMDAENEKRIV